MTNQETAEGSHKSLASRIFTRHVRDNLGEMKLSFRGGKLSPKEGDWNNVINHQLVQAGAGLVVAEALGLPDDQTSILFRTILVHDWDKRLDIKPEDFGPDDIAKAQALFQAANPDMSLIEATHPGFWDKIINGEATFLQKLQFYLDDITKNDEIAALEDRIMEVAARRSDLGPDFYQKLKEKGIEIEESGDIPNWINSKLREKYG